MQLYYFPKSFNWCWQKHNCLPWLETVTYSICLISPLRFSYAKNKQKKKPLFAMRPATVNCVESLKAPFPFTFHCWSFSCRVCILSARVSFVSTSAVAFFKNKEPWFNPTITILFRSWHFENQYVWSQRLNHYPMYYIFFLINQYCPAKTAWGNLIGAL